MGLSLVDAFVSQRAAWIGLIAIVLIIAVIALVQRGAQPSPRRVLLLSGLVSALAAFGTLVTMALAIPRIVWRPIPPPPYAVASGDSWRALRAPATALFVGGKPEVALAGVDAAGKVRLFGMFSGAPIKGLPDAPNDPPVQGEPRICQVVDEQCRAWPRAWPAPSPSPGGSDFVWTKELFAGALAYDVENDRFLHHVEGLRTAGAEVAMTGGSASPSDLAGTRTVTGTWALEQVGKLTNEPPRDGPAALFVVRRIADSRLDAVRVIAVPAGASSMFSVERATLSLAAPPAAYNWFARPLSMALLLWFPAVTLFLQAAPAWWASRRRKRLEKGEPVSEMPADAATFAASARQAMAARVYPFTMLCVGLALTAPAVVAIVAVVSGR